MICLWRGWPPLEEEEGEERDVVQANLKPYTDFNQQKKQKRTAAPADKDEEEATGILHATETGI